VRALDFADDRLESVLDALSDDLRWQEFEAALNQRLIRVYDLNPQRVVDHKIHERLPKNERARRSLSPSRGFSFARIKRVE